MSSPGPRVPPPGTARTSARHILPLASPTAARIAGGPRRLRHLAASFRGASFRPPCARDGVGTLRGGRSAAPALCVYRSQPTMFERIGAVLGAKEGMRQEMNEMEACIHPRPGDPHAPAAAVVLQAQR